LRHSKSRGSKDQDRDREREKEQEKNRKNFLKGSKKALPSDDLRGKLFRTYNYKPVESNISNKGNGNANLRNRSKRTPSSKNGSYMPFLSRYDSFDNEFYDPIHPQKSK
jgi:hypothetical protein